MNMTIEQRTEEAIEILVKASGPVSKDTIIAEVHIQVDNTIEDYQVAEAMNKLMKRGIIELYDTCDTWV